MRIGAVALGASLAVAGLVFPGAARACKTAPPNLHAIDPAQVGVDQTPPQLGETTLAELRHSDNDSNGCSGKCGWAHNARIINLATDDMTPANRIGYRVTLVSGAAPNLFPSPDGSAIVPWGDGSELTVYWDGDDDFDFTLQLIAVDAAGNTSAPKTVRIHDGGGCSIGGRRVSDGVALAVVVVALVGAGLRRRRGRQGRRRSTTVARSVQSTTFE